MSNAHQQEEHANVTGDLPAKHERLTHVAQHTLDHFNETVKTARAALQDARPASTNALAVVNPLTADKALRNLHDISEGQMRELRLLCEAPAIARVVTEDDDGNRRVYFFSEATPYRSPRDDSAAASYRSPAGRLAALPVGGEAEIRTAAGIRNLVVLERATLRPKRTNGEWDSINSVIEGEGFGPFTVSSFLELLRSRLGTQDEEDLLAAALADDRAAALILEGLRRDAITKMELRELAILDQFQDEIFRLPLDTRLVILGPPGTGKTTTLIKRLGLKADAEHLSEDERDAVNGSVAGSGQHAQSWLMFTPTNLLKQYVKEALARERIPASDARVQTWDDFRRDLARNRFGILRTTSGGPFVMKDSLPSVTPKAIAGPREWFSDFDSWQQQFFWNDLRRQANALVEDERRDISQLGRRLAETLPAGTARLSGAAFSEIAAASQQIDALTARLKASTDKAIRDIINAELKRDRQFLVQLAEFVTSLGDQDDGEDAETEDEDDVQQPIRIGMDAAVDALTRALRARARSVAAGRSLSRQSRNSRLWDWLGARAPSDALLREIGRDLLVQGSARKFLNPLRRYINGLPLRYRRFRRERQDAGLWYYGEGYTASDVNPLEVDLLLLAALNAGRALLGDRRIAREFGQGQHSSLAVFRDLYRNQVTVDEATDFSPIQLSCMAALCDPATQSFVACGDFNQRITVWGSRSESDFAWLFRDIEIRPIAISYRHSRQLNELARSIALLSSADVPESTLPQRVRNDGFEPVLGLGLSDHESVAKWLSERITEIEKLTQALPPIAVLVANESDVGPLATALDAVLAASNIKAVPCPQGQFAGQDNDVRVFAVQHIKGLEFEAVFFLGIDRLAAQEPELFEKYLYVGATRAAMYLGVTTAGSSLPAKMVQLQGAFRESWPGA